MKTLNEIIAENIINLRKHKKMTQTALAKALNYTDKTISKWENASAAPSISVLKEIAELFNVTVDYIITEHNGNFDTKYSSKNNIPNKIIITSLAVLVVWLIATFYYTYTLMFADKDAWISFIIAVPVSVIVLLVFNGIWGNRKNIFIILSILIWSSAASAYISVFYFLSLNLWQVFILGIPLQVAVILWSNLK